MIRVAEILCRLFRRRPKPPGPWPIYYLQHESVVELTERLLAVREEAEGDIPLLALCITQAVPGLGITIFTEVLEEEDNPASDLKPTPAEMENGR